ncbi:replication protein C, IncQ-type [Billgrantia endophytica]|uniref:Uncharacterized protein n=1 Tax=Billgrantia endophytica TaxID=2033802 RepID=A0A2N7TUB5_9GAMM|nr:replication protein C, IncQ-type [Halomonas endophytica]PMR71774.1 hypothetical protein C1H69_22845 [Halomonas endophytica]
MNKIQNHKEITFAMQDRASSLMSIFKYIPKIKAKEDRPKYSVKSEFNNRKIEITCFDMLDTTDQAVLLAIIALAPIKDEDNRRPIIDIMTPEDERSELASILINGFNSSFNPFGELIKEYSKCAVINCSINRIVNILGMSEGIKSREIIANSIKRLALTSYTITANCNDGVDLSDEFTQPFIFYHKVGKQYTISLNGIFTSAFNKQYSRIQLDERREIGSKNSLAQLIHSHFCATVPNGEKGHKFFCTTLIERFMHKDYLAKDEKRVRRTVKEAIEKIDKLDGWKVVTKGEGKNLIFHVTRT